MPEYNPWGTPIFPNTGGAFGVGGPAEDAQRQPTIVDNILSHIAGALGRGFMAPGQALQSTTPLTSEQMVAPAHDMTSLLVSGGMPMAEKGAAGIAGGKLGGGLPMDEASRLARATEQGFTRDAYRGEGAPISGDSFIEGHSGRYDPGFLGSGGIYSTNRPHLANDYAMLKAAKERAADEAPNVMPLKVKMDNPFVITSEEKRAISGLSREERDAWLRDVYARGHDGIIVKYGGGNPALRSSGYEEYVAPATSYRSRFAKFDPANIGKAGLLGGIAGASALPLFAGDNR